MTQAELAAAALKETKPLPTIVSNDVSKTVPVSGVRGGLIRRMLRLATKWNPFSPQFVAHASPKAASPAVNRLPTQPELSLDQVKVVRNDLNDADLEIVPARPGVTMKHAPVVRVEESAALAATPPR
jgi:hypothetical protein